MVQDPADMELCTVLENVPMGPRGRLLRLCRRFSGFPGQLVAVTVGDAIAPRLYSVASAVGSETTDILFNMVDDGQLSPQLWDLGPGDSLWLGPEQGEFASLGPNEYWIANGSGIAPFLSMAASGLGPGKTLIHGARFIDDLFGRDQVAQAVDRYVPCVTGEPGEAVYEGRLTQWLRDEPLDLEASYLLCGSAAMVVQVRDILLAKGVQYEAISGEVYF